MNLRQLASLFYFMYYAAAGVLFPYLNLYYQQAGMSTKQIGILAALPTITVLVASPLWGGVADALHVHKRLLPLVILGTMLPVAGLIQAQVFGALAILVLFHAIMNAPIIPLADNASLQLLGESSDEYGKLRIWGAVGFGLSAWGAGILAESYGISTIFITYLILMALTAWISSRLPAPPPLESGSFMAGFRSLSSNKQWLNFLLAIFLAGTGYSILNNYFVIYLNELGAGESLYGLSIAAAGISELPVYILSPLLLRKMKPRGMLIMAFIAFVVRAIAYSLIVDPRWAVAAQLLHGLTFSALWIAAVVYAGQIAPAGLGASAQAALGAVMFGLAGGSGALLGALLYDMVGPQTMFQLAGVLAIVGLLFFVTSKQADESLPVVESI